MSFPFNVRVYGVLEHANHILLSTEKYAGKTFTKFPGGALEFGEGLKDAIIREYKEETGLKIRVLDHLYTTDFFQESAFNSLHQVISVYYTVELIELKKETFEITALEPDHTFSWIPRSNLNAGDVTFPIDKHLIEKVLLRQ